MEEKTGEIKGKLKEKKGEMKGKAKEVKGDIKGKLQEMEGELKSKKERENPEEIKIEEKNIENDPEKDMDAEKGAKHEKEPIKTEEIKEATHKTKIGAEKLLSDLLGGIKEKQEEWSEKISDYTSEGEKPLIDVLENDTHIIIRIDLPGVDKDDVSVHLTEDAAEIEAMFPGKKESGNFITRERSYGKVKRSIDLSKKIKEKEAKATFKNCVLTIELPKVVKDRYKMEIK
jgi:HSP20 family protein